MIEKYKGIFPAFYACYDENGDVSEQGTKALVKYFIDAGVQGLYVGGSSGECIYLTVEERKKTLEWVMEAAAGKLCIIAHVACNNTKQSCELAAHAESVGADAIAAIPPIYFKLPDRAIAKYWNDISAAAPNTDMILYNIPQLAGVALSTNLLAEMLKNNPNVVGVKNSSMVVQDIQMFKREGKLAGKDIIVYNGPDEQFISGRIIGAEGGIGGTYGVMPELFVKMNLLLAKGDLENASDVQNDVDEIIYAMCSGKGNMYAVAKAVIKMRSGVDCGSVRLPLLPLGDGDDELVAKIAKMVDEAIAKAKAL